MEPGESLEETDLRLKNSLVGDVMKKIRIKEWVLEVDVERTRGCYQAYQQITESCDCLFCKNFVSAIGHLPPDVLEFFDSLGGDPSKEGEVSEYCENADGTHLYGCFYHIVERLISGPDCWVTTGEETSHLEANLLEISGFTFGFTYGISLLPDEFPEPAVQLEVQGNIPWVIAERP